MKRVIDETIITDGGLGKQNNKAMTKNRKKIILTVFLSIILAICAIAIAFFSSNEYSRITNYNSAIKKYEAGNYAEAKALFLSLSEYKDSSEYLSECSYQIAIDNFNNGEYSKALDEFSELGDYKNSADYLLECLYEIAIVDFDNGEYAIAADTFSELVNYKKSADYLLECLYQIAIVDLDNDEYDNAIETFLELENYKDSSEYLHKAILERKYANLNVNIDIDPIYFDMAGINSAEEVEDCMSAFIYGVWFSKETGKEFMIDFQQINDRPYAVNYATITGGTVVVNFYYLDEPGNNYNISNHWQEFEYIDVHISTLSISQTNSENNEVDTLYSISLEEYNSFNEENSQAAARQQNYTDDEIIQKAFSTFKNKIGGNYSGAGKLYHTANYSDAYVSYDWASKTYSCTFIGKYTTNIFDIFGTSTQTYFVSAEFLDTGSGLELLYFNIA